MDNTNRFSDDVNNLLTKLENLEESIERQSNQWQIDILELLSDIRGCLHKHPKSSDN
jgi:hypothetical protein